MHKNLNCIVWEVDEMEDGTWGEIKTHDANQAIVLKEEMPFC